MASFKQWTVCHISMFVTFVVSGLMINVLQALLFFTLGSINRRIFRKINFYLNWIINAQVLFIGTWWSGSEGILYADSKEVLQNLGKENALVTMNHHYELDWMFGWMGADFYSVLGNSRVFVKKMLRYVPVVGWSWTMSDVVFLARDWEKDRLILGDCVRQLCDYPDPIWLLIFAEGTRMSPEKLEASREFAKLRNLPDLKHHLVPRTKGFIETLRNIDKKKMRALYDVTIVMPKDSPSSVSSVLCGKKSVGHMYIRRFDLNKVPSDEAGLTQFLMQVYKEKDELKENFLNKGTFQLDGKFEVGHKVPLNYRWPVLVNSMILNALISIPLAARLGFMVCSGSVFQVSIAAVICSFLYFSLRKFINITKISKASAYGKKNK